MKKILSLFLCFTVFLLFNAHAQQPVMEWFKLIGGYGNNVAWEMEMDGAGNIYVVGFFTDSLDFDPTTNRVLHSGGGKDGYILKLGPDGNLLWVKQIKGPGDNEIRSVFIDDHDNSYTTGSFTGQAMFDTSNYYQSADSTDVFIQKRNAAGDLIWTRTFGGYGADEGISIAVDDEGNVYTTGMFTDSNKVDNTLLISNGDNDIFNCKHDSSGNLVWAHEVGGTGKDIPDGIKVVENVPFFGTCLYISAGFENTVNFYGVRSYTSAGFSDVVGFMIKGSDGNLVSGGGLDYVARMGGSSHDNSNDFVFDDDLNIYSTGSFAGTSDLDPKDATQQNYISKGWTDAYVLKMNSDAFFQWALHFGTNGIDEGTAIGIDTSGNIYTAGSFQNTIEFYLGNDTISLTALGISQDIYINKISPSGNLIWLARISGDSTAWVYDIEVDNNGDIFLAGYYTGGINFIGDNSLGTIGSSSTPNDDIFLIKLNQRYGMSGLLLDSISNGIDSGMVYLIELDPNAAGADTLERAYTDTAGRFHFNFVDTGSYIMKADATEEHPTTMPTYYPNAFYWYDAEIFELVSDTSDIKIDILYTPTPPTPAQGMGRIWGRLVEGSTFRGPSDPIDSIVIGMIRPDISNDVYMLDTTDIDGYFEFLNLPAGNYALYPDISGIPVDTVGWTDISISASDTETITFVADSNIITYDNDTIIVDVKEYTSDLKLWPNPVYDHLSVSLTSPIKAVRVFDMKGAEVEVESILTEKRVQIKTEVLKKGIYILELQYEGKTGLAKFVKH